MVKKRRKKTAQKKTKKKAKKKNSRNVSLVGRGLLLFNFFVVLLISVCIYVAWLDYKVNTVFEGKRWLLPARVYAKPDEIYVGMQYSKDIFIQALQSRAYQAVSQVNKSGQYVASSNQVILHTRKFAYWDRVDPAIPLLIEWQGKTISSIKNINTNEELAIIRLEPFLIGKIYPSHQEDRVLVPYDEVPKFLVDALVVVEDRNFYFHSGFDPKGFTRALLSNLKAGRLTQGGSTLTQQLVKNLILSSERSLIRKINELFMALILEMRYSKAEIMSSYINEVYLGQDGAHEIHGFGTAAEFYFDKPLYELNKAQIAMLVGMVKGASFYNPRKNISRATDRRNLVLRLLKEYLVIDKNEYEYLIQQPLNVIPHKLVRSSGYEHFLSVVKQQLLEDYKMQDLKTEGLRIFTTMDKKLQDKWVKIGKNKLIEIEKKKKLKSNTLELAAILSQADTGDVLALIGSRRSRMGDFNRALSASRPIGSLIKPFVYLNALSQPERYNAISLLNDKRISIPQADGTTWSPQNYDHKERGEVPLYTALAQSYNLATIQLGMQLGLDSVVAYLNRAGVDKRIPEYPSLLLGAIDLTPMQVLEIYQPLASDGFKTPIKTIDFVLDMNGNPLNRRELQIQSVFKASDVTVLNGVLSQVFIDGTARSVSRQFASQLPLAGKTGTTNELRDSWFVGYSSNLIGVVWTGRDDNKNSGLSGASGALQIWAEMMPKNKMTPLTQLSDNEIEWLAVKNLVFSCDKPITLPFYREFKPAEHYLCH